MAEHFIGGNPYTDPAAGNVKDGSVDYYDFDWGSAVIYAAEEETGTGCATASACGENSPKQSDDTGYAIGEE